MTVSLSDLKTFLVNTPFFGGLSDGSLGLLISMLAWISTDWNPSNAGFGKGFRRLRISALYGELIRRVHAVSFASATILGESGAPRFRCIDLRRMPASWRSQVSWFNSRLTPDMANDTAHMCLSDHYMN